MYRVSNYYKQENSNVIAAEHKQEMNTYAL
jgi:hypothetical protein